MAVRVVMVMVVAMVMAMVMIVVMVVVLVAMVVAVVVTVAATLLLRGNVRHRNRVRAGRDHTLPTCRLLLRPSTQRIQRLGRLLPIRHRGATGMGTVLIVGVVARV